MKYLWQIYCDWFLVLTLCPSTQRIMPRQQKELFFKIKKLVFIWDCPYGLEFFFLSLSSSTLDATKLCFCFHSHWALEFSNHISWPSHESLWHFSSDYASTWMWWMLCYPSYNGLRTIQTLNNSDRKKWERKTDSLTMTSVV